MVLAYFYIAYNDGIFSGMSVDFMENLGNILFVISFFLLVPVVISIENKKVKSLCKWLCGLVPMALLSVAILSSVPYNKPVKIVSYEDSNKFMVVKNLDVARKAVKAANDDDIRNKDKVETMVDELLNLENSK